MERVIILRYAEIHLKGKNRPMFERALINNIKTCLAGFQFELIKMHGREVIQNYDVAYEDEICNRLGKVAGVHSYSICDKVETSEDSIVNVVRRMAKKLSGTFKVITNRADKSFKYTSSDFSAKLGEIILSENPKLLVDLKSPQHLINVDIREEGVTFIFDNTKIGMGGMPVATAGEGLLLLSGGIDSPVAGFMACKRGVKLSCVHFESPPYTNLGAHQKVLDLAKKLTAYNGDIKIYFVSTTKIQEMIHSKCNPEFGITLLRRFMLRIAEKIAIENGLKMLITGESLGQVASQTIESMATIQESLTTNIPIIKPLICFDKEETINLSKQIETYDISIVPYADCCTVFLPKEPATKPKLEKVKSEEARLNVEGLIDEATRGIKVENVKQ